MFLRSRGVFGFFTLLSFPVLAFADLADGGTDEITVRLRLCADQARQVVVEVPSGCTNRFDILSCSSVTAGVWSVAAQGLTATGGTVTWTDCATSSAAFYMATVADTDSRTDPDGDGLPWGAERFRFGTDPTCADSDGDGIPDGWEVSAGLSPTTQDSSGDADCDGWSNLQEYLRGGRIAAACAPDSNDSLKLRLCLPSGE